MTSVECFIAFFSAVLVLSSAWTWALEERHMSRLKITVRTGRVRSY